MRVPELRPLGVGEILDVAIKLYLRNAATLIKIVAIFVIPSALLSLIVLLSFVPEGSVVVNGQIFVVTESDLNQLVIGTIAAALLGAIATLIGTGAALRAVGDAYLGKDPSAGESLRFAARRFFSLLWISILSIVAITAGFFALIIPGIYLMVSLSVVVPALVLEDLRGGKALNRSFSLIKGRWWPAFGTLLLGVILIPTVVAYVIGFIFDAVLLGDVGSVSTMFTVQSIGDLLSGILTTPIQVATLAVLYFDLRVRKEGFDLQLLAAQMGEAPPMTSPGQPPLTPPPQYPPPPPSPPSGPQPG